MVTVKLLPGLITAYLKPRSITRRILLSCVLASLVIVTACSRDKTSGNSITEVQIQKTDSITIPLPFAYRSFASLKIQSYTRNDTDFAMVADIDHSSLLELDLSNARLHRNIEVSQLKQDRYPVFQFYYLSRDRIAIAKDATNSLYSHDSLFFIVNGEGAADFIDMSESMFRLEGEPRDSSAIAWQHQFSPLIGQGQRIFVPPAAYPSYGWSGVYKNEHNVPFLCYIDMDKNEMQFEVALEKTPDPISSDSIYGH